MFQIGFYLLFIALFSFSIVLGGIIYQHIVEFPNWNSNIPNSLLSYQNFFSTSDFGSFFKIFMPLSSICLLISIIILCNEVATSLMIAAFVGLLLITIYTRSYFVPKHQLLFSERVGEIDSSKLKKTANQWKRGNYLRIFIMLATMFTFLKAYEVLS